MKRSLIAVALVALTAAPVAMADHNSVWGMGYANMPNDVHNTRLDPTVTDEEFRALVKKGVLAHTPTRCDADDPPVGCYVEDPEEAE
jgi:hypothetical protein